MIVHAQHVGNQHTDRLCALGGQIGQVHCNELPGDIRRILPLEDVNPVDERIVRQDEGLAPEPDNGRIVFQSARGPMARKRAQGRDELGFVQRPISLATASRMPFTNLASRSSKKALATSTYSLMAAALGTSLRASNS